MVRYAKLAPDCSPLKAHAIQDPVSQAPRAQPIDLPLGVLPFATAQLLLQCTWYPCRVTDMLLPTLGKYVFYCACDIRMFQGSWEQLGLQ